MAAQVPSNAIETLKELLGIDTDPPSDGADKEKKTEPPKDKDVANPLGLFEQVKDALARYRSTVTWIVGAYAAVWTVLVGTAPFAGLGDLEWWERLAAGSGLLVAGLGAMLGIYATSRVLEPEDASLGELKLRQPRVRRDGKHPIEWLRWESADKVENESNSTMWRLFNAESEAYFGTKKDGKQAVRELIHTLDEEAETLREKRQAAATAVDDAARKQAEGEVAAAQIAYDESLARRERTLAVAVTYEVRGKYMSSRRLLLLGALLVLLGTLGYLYFVVAESDDDKPKAPAAAATAAPAALTPVQVRLQPSAWRGLETTAGRQGCVGGDTGRDDKLQTAAYLEGDATTKGPWNLILPPKGDDAACRAVSFTLEPPDGRVLPASAPAAPPG